jgi:hypothetical protein
LANGNNFYATVTVYTTNPNDVNDQRQGGTITSSSKIPSRAPDAPSFVNLDAGDEQMTVDWSAAVLNGSVFTEYLVELFPGAYSITLSDQSTLSHTFTGLSNGTSYYARVTVYATNPNDSSIVISGGSTNSDSQKPFRAADAPATIELTPGDEQVQVDWSPAVLNGTDFDSYWVTLFSGGGMVVSVEPRVLTTSYTFTGLTNGTSYYATVTVITTNPNNGTQVQGGTITSSSKIPSRAADAPNSVVLAAGDEQMQVNWSAAVLNGGVFSSFGVQLFNNNEYLVSSYFVNNVNTLSHTFTGLTNGTSYYATVTVYTTNPNDGTSVTGGSNTSDAQIAFGETPPPTLAYYPGYQTLRVVWSDVELNGGRFEEYKVRLYERLSVDASGNNVLSSLLSEVKYSDFYQNTHTFTGLTIGVNYVIKVIVVTSDPNGAEPAAGGDAIDSPAGSITAKPHDNPIIIGSATIDHSTKTVSVTVDKNGSEITDYMAIVQPGNYMQKINDSSLIPNGNGTFTLSMVFDALDASGNPLYPALLSNPISSALMVVGNGRGFTAVEFNGSTQTVLSPEHHRDLP